MKKEYKKKHEIPVIILSAISIIFLIVMILIGYAVIAGVVAVMIKAVGL